LPSRGSRATIANGFRNAPASGRRVFVCGGDIRADGANVLTAISHVPSRDYES